MALKKSYSKKQFDTVDTTQSVDNPSSGFYVTYLSKGAGGGHKYNVKYNDGGTVATIVLTDFDGDYTSLTSVPSTFTPSAHTHTVSDITDLAAGPGIDLVGGNTISIESDLRDGIQKIGYTNTHIQFVNSDKINFYANNSTARVAYIDSSGNLHVKGDVVANSTSV